ncbi:MAG: aminotransferase [delta proteobacterium ML8_F1]|nr:MAG: aminotransferase [delta proteobacterium ML8_F1]
MPEFAKRMKTMEKSAKVIRNLFGAMSDPDLISLGGGAPATEALPVEAVREILNDIMQRETRGQEVLQYGSVMGLKDLREVVVHNLLRPVGIEADLDEIMIINGGLEAMNLICQLYIEPGDVILVESPTFVQSVEIFEMFEARCIGVAMDERGMDLEDLKNKIDRYSPKMIYVIPTFQNPSGRTLSLDRREALAAIGSERDIVILEDDPYRDIRYSGETLPPIKTFDQTGHTILANSFSKIFSPGSRLGYIYASKNVMDRLFDAKTATNSHTGIMPQMVCAEFFKRGYYESHHKMICDLYRERRDTMVAAIDEYFPEGTRRVYPHGGLFTWVELPGGINTTDLLEEAVSNPLVKVAFVAGEGFFVGGDGKGSNAMRISFGSVPPDRIIEGIKRLGRLIEAKLSHPEAER